MQIHINTDEPLSDVDKQVLAVLAGGVPSTPAPAPAKAAAPKATPKASKAVEAPAEEPEEAPEEDEATGATLEEAVALATKMVSNGEAAKVKAALGTVGAKKVSEIPGDKVDEFIAALS